MLYTIPSPIIVSHNKWGGRKAPRPKAQCVVFFLFWLTCPIFKFWADVARFLCDVIRQLAYYKDNICMRLQCFEWFHLYLVCLAYDLFFSLLMKELMYFEHSCRVCATYCLLAFYEPDLCGVCFTRRGSCSKSKLKSWLVASVFIKDT